MSQNHSCERCDRTVDDNHKLCNRCRRNFSGGNDNDPPGPGIAPASPSGPTMNLAPSAEPTHRANPAGVPA